MGVDTELTKVSYALRNNAGTIILPEWCMDDLANLHVPDELDLFTQSETQEYPIGTQCRKGDRLFRYCKAGETMAVGHQGFLKCARTICPGAVGGGGSEAALYADAAAGATKIYLGDTTDRVKNYYEDGHLIVMSDTYGYARYRILGSDAATSLDYVVVYIAPSGLRQAHTTTSGTVGAYRSPWIDVRSMLTSGNQSWFSAVGMASFAITTAYFFWLQTAGPCWGTGASTWPGQTAYQREVMANTDGSLIGLAAATVYYQKVGYLLSGTTSIYGDVFMMLQLDQ